MPPQTAQGRWSHPPQPPPLIPNEDVLPVLLTRKSSPGCWGTFASVADAESEAPVSLTTMEAVVVLKHQLLSPGRRQKQDRSPTPLGRGESLCCKGHVKLIKRNAASLKALHHHPGTHGCTGKVPTRWGLCGRREAGPRQSVLSGLA